MSTSESYNPSSIFKTFTVIPTYGKNSALLRWEISSNYLNNFNLEIYKSRDGYTDWFKLSLTDTLGNVTTPSTGYYKDSNLGSNNQKVEWYYQLRLVNPSTTVSYCSNAITYRHLLSNLEFGTVNEVLKQEYLSADNIDMFLCRPKSNTPDPLDLDNLNNQTATTLASTVNVLTGQQTGVVVDEVSYGKTYKGGFSNPILVNIHIDKTVKIDADDVGSGNGTMDTEKIQFTSFSYPKFLKGDMIIDPITDRRFLFDRVESEDIFKGVIPLFFTGVMTELPRYSEEYKYELPACAITYIQNLKK